MEAGWAGCWVAELQDQHAQKRAEVLVAVPAAAAAPAAEAEAVAAAETARSSGWEGAWCPCLQPEAPPLPSLCAARASTLGSHCWDAAASVPHRPLWCHNLYGGVTVNLHYSFIR